MQSDGNSFCGDVVLDSFNIANKDEDNILDKMFQSKYVWINIMMILIFLWHFTKVHTNTTVALNQILWVPYWYLLYFFKCAFYLINLKI